MSVDMKDNHGCGIWFHVVNLFRVWDFSQRSHGWSLVPDQFSTIRLTGALEKGGFLIPAMFFKAFLLLELILEGVTVGKHQSPALPVLWSDVERLKVASSDL